MPIGKPCEHCGERHVGEPQPDAAGGGEHHDTEVHPAQVGDGEGRAEDGDREELRRHSVPAGARNVQSTWESAKWRRETSCRWRTWCVLDLTVARAGPTAVRQLADWGAEVIRIEPAGAHDDVTGGRRHGSDFQNLHRNKRCITLDLKQPRGREIFLALARSADVVVENFRADVKHRLGIDYDSVRAVNPRIVYGSISGFGQDGPYRDRPGVDQIAQGLGGLMSVTGLPGQGPVRVGVAISDLAAGLYLACGILVALHERARSGEGQWVTTSLLEALIGMLDFQAARFLVEGEVAGQAGNHHPTLAPMGVFPTADGHINIAASSGAQFRSLLEALGAARARAAARVRRHPPAVAQPRVAQRRDRAS